MKTTTLASLNDGDEFWVPGCLDTMKNCRLLRLTPCSAYVVCDELRGESWKRENIYISNSTFVVFGRHEEEKVIDKPAKIAQNKETKYKKNMSTEQNTNTGKRGRVAKNYGFTLPEGEFTIETLTTANSGAKKSDLSNFLMREIKANRVAKVGTVEKTEKTRGRKKCVYKLL